MNEEKLSQLCTDVEVIKTRLGDFIDYVNDDLCKINDDHEERLRIVEHFKSKVIGAVAVAGAIGGIIGAVFQYFAGKI